MATRSTIAILETSGVVKQIYCHWDGYIEHNGRHLKLYYKTPELVKELISHGDMSVLNPNINPTGAHSFNKPEAGVCVYYGRDRGESNTEFRVYRDWDYFRFDRQKEEYDYLFVEAECKWYLLGPKAQKNTFLTELDNLAVLPEKTAYELLFDSPAIKKIYADILTGVLNYADFVKHIETIATGDW